MPDSNSNSTYVFYYYTPSLAAGAIFVALFTLTTGMHFWQMLRRRSWFCIPLVVGGIFEITGYIGRLLSHGQAPDFALGPFVMQSTLLLVAPALFSATIYMVLGRIIISVDGEKDSLIRRKWLTKIFVGGDIFSFFTQGAGAGILATGTASAAQTGEDIIIAGLIIQILFFVFFLTTASVFSRRTTRSLSQSQTLSASHNATLQSNSWKNHLRAIYVAGSLILLRNVFRVVEYADGHTGYLMRHEVFVYVFDALPMFAVLLWYNWVHPSGAIGNGSVRDGEETGMTGSEDGFGLKSQTRAEAGSGVSAV